MTRKSTTVRQIFLKRRDSLLCDYDFVDADSLPNHFTPSLVVDADGRKLVPMFQFAPSGKVYPTLKAVLPELKLGRDSWSICFWLTSKQKVFVEAVVPTQQQVEECKTFDDVIRLGTMAEEQSNVVTSTPIELLATDQDELFVMFYQATFELEIIPIPTKSLILE